MLAIYFYSLSSFYLNFFCCRGVTDIGNLFVFFCVRLQKLILFVGTTEWFFTAPEST